MSDDVEAAEQELVGSIVYAVVVGVVMILAVAFLCYDWYKKLAKENATLPKELQTFDEKKKKIFFFCCICCPICGLFVSQHYLEQIREKKKQVEDDDLEQQQIADNTNDEAPQYV